MLSFPAPSLGTCMQVDGFPTLLSVTYGVSGLIAGPSRAFRPLNY